MTLDDKIPDDEQCLTLAKEKGGLYKGQRGFYIATSCRGDDLILLRAPLSDREELVGHASFWIDELGYPGLEPIDLITIQTHDIIAGPFETRQIAMKVLPFAIRERYLREH